MTEPTDDLIELLAAADPVDSRELPTSFTVSARQVLENAMNDESPNPSIRPSAVFGTESTDHAVPVGPPVAGEPPPQIVSEPRLLDEHRTRRSRSSGRGLLVGAAAAVLLLVAGVLVFSPDNTQSAVAAVHGAAAATADASSASITTTFSLDGTSGGAAEQLSGRFDASYSGSDVRFSVAIDESSGTSVPAEMPFSEGRLVDDVLYLNDGGQWFSIDTQGLLGQVVTDYVDPRSILETVQGLTETTEVGPATVDGLETTHYRSVVDLGDESLSQSGWLAFDGLQVDTEGEVTVDLYVGTDGILRRLDLTGNVRSTVDTADAGTFDISTRFFDIGSDIVVEAPADAQVFSPLDGVLTD